MYYRRKLPHFIPDGATFFVTYRLAGSMPIEIIKQLKEKHERGLATMKEIHDGKTTYQHVVRNMHKRNFANVDAYLDMNLNEPHWLKNEAVASMVAESLHFIAQDWVEISCFTIMANHVHVLMRPKNNVPGLMNILQRHKSFTGKTGNEILQRNGQFWEHESYDHVVRNAEEFERIVAYILNNPVKAGLVKKWQDWKWTWLCDALQ